MRKVQYVIIKTNNSYDELLQRVQIITKTGSFSKRGTELLVGIKKNGKEKN